jgi:serine/threonine protein kinase
MQCANSSTLCSYVALDYVDGGSLQGLLDRHPNTPMPLSQAQKYASSLLLLLLLLVGTDD